MKTIAALFGIFMCTPALAEMRGDTVIDSDTGKISLTAFQNAEHEKKCFEAKDPVLLGVEDNLFLVMFKGSREKTKNEGLYYKDLLTAQAVKRGIEKTGKYCEITFRANGAQWVLGVIE